MNLRRHSAASAAAQMIASHLAPITPPIIANQTVQPNEIAGTGIYNTQVKEATR